MGDPYAELDRAVAARLERECDAGGRAGRRSELRRAAWRRRRWPMLAIAAAFYLLVVSPLCLGPAVYLDRRGIAPPSGTALALVAWPSVLLLGAAGQEPRLDAYVRWWDGLAVRHGGR